MRVFTILFLPLLLGLTLTAQAQQPTPPLVTLSADSVALFTIEEDAL